MSFTPTRVGPAGAPWVALGAAGYLGRLMPCR
jgi:hypothetical protein